MTLQQKRENDDTKAENREKHDITWEMNKMMTSREKFLVEVRPNCPKTKKMSFVLDEKWTCLPTCCLPQQTWQSETSALRINGLSNTYLSLVSTVMRNPFSNRCIPSMTMFNIFLDAGRLKASILILCPGWTQHLNVNWLTAHTQIHRFLSLTVFRVPAPDH